jgi:serine/threonine protein kinase
MGNLSAGVGNNCEPPPASGLPCSSNEGSKGGATSAKPVEKIHKNKEVEEWKKVMRKYAMDMSQEGHMGAGTSSICRKGKLVETGDMVAIKVYKPPKSNKKDDGTRLMKFKRQVEVLKELQTPFVPPGDPRLWCPQLAKTKPSRLFMVLIDHSQTASGEPGADPQDGVLYVITELAQYSLKDFLADRKNTVEPLSKETVADMTKALILVMAGLHAKGMVHLDLKPENLMVFDGCLKLIDVDGCVKVGTEIAVTDPSISFSPCYCAPEWASFLLAENEPTITVNPALDVWSVGCTACEFVTLDAILKPTYANFLKNSRNHREAGFLFMDWLSAIKKPHIPKKVSEFDPGFVNLVTEMLLVCDKRKRKTCAECLRESTYLAQNKFHRSKTNPIEIAADAEDDESPVKMPTEGTRKIRHRVEDHSRKAIHQGTLWKLNNGKDPNDPKQWLQRDMWIANNGSLCYFSQLDNKRLVLLDSHKLHAAQVSQPKQYCKEHAVQVDCVSGQDEMDTSKFVFATASAVEADEWVRYLEFAAHMDIIPTMFLGASVAEDLKLFRCEVKNRRMKVEGDSAYEFEPVFKASLWKVKTAGDKMIESDWFKRDAWLSRNGSLVYWSVRDQRELVYFSSADIARSEVVIVDNDKSCKPWSFQVNLPPHEGMEFAPGEFAADSEEMRDKWFKEIRAFNGSD